MLDIIFYGFSLLALGSASMVVAARNPVRSALFLVLTFFAVAGLWLLMNAEFLAITLVLVYVGAVLVLFLFVIMMLDVELSTLKATFTRALPLGGATALFLIVGLIVTLCTREGQTEIVNHAKPLENPLIALGELLYTEYLFPFEIAGFILLVAIISAISLTVRGARERKTQSVSQQQQVTKAQRLTIVKMPVTLVALTKPNADKL